MINAFNWGTTLWEPDTILPTTWNLQTAAYTMWVMWGFYSSNTNPSDVVSFIHWHNENQMLSCKLILGRMLSLVKTCIKPIWQLRSSKDQGFFSFFPILWYWKIGGLFSQEISKISWKKKERAFSKRNKNPQFGQKKPM